MPNSRAIPPPASLAESVERLRPLNKWSSLLLGAPPAGEAQTWLPHAALGETGTIQELVARRREEEQYEEEATAHVFGNYTFRDILYTPLGFAGYLFAREQRVPRIAGNAYVKNAGWFADWYWERPEAIVLEDDPLAGAPGIETVADAGALATALFDEVERFCEPLVAGFREHRYVAVANAWGSILDSVAYGAQLAGTSDEALGGAGAWERWEAAIHDRRFPVRRRPRRLVYEWAPGEEDEAMVRAGCCLWYLTAESRAGGTQDYCTTCYLKDDDSRIAVLADWKRKVASGEVEDH